MNDDDFDGGLTERTTAASWIGALVACGLLIGGYFVARDYIQGGSAGAEVVNGTATDAKQAKKQKKRKRPRRPKPDGAASPGAEQNYDDYDWTQDYEEDDLVLGDILSDRDEVVEPARAAPPPPPYEPKPNEWQADGAYRATAKWAEPGARSGVVEIDLTSRSESSPLDEAQVKQVLNVRRLAPCYDPWVQKIPQMRGRVHMAFIVGGDGHVASVEVTRSALRSRVVEQCLVERARGFRFPAARGGAKTRFETHFDFTNR